MTLTHVRESLHLNPPTKTPLDLGHAMIREGEKGYGLMKLDQQGTFSCGVQIL